VLRLANGYKKYNKAGNLIISLGENLQNKFSHAGDSVELTASEDSCLKVTINKENNMQVLTLKESFPDLEVFISQTVDDDYMLNEIQNFIDSFIEFNGVEPPAVITKLLPKFCIKCGAPIKPTMKFCTKCGNKINW
jgi:hypothetical protein